MEDTVQVAKQDMDELLELLGGYKTMLLEHERRLGIVETVLVEAMQSPSNREQRRKRR